MTKTTKLFTTITLGASALCLSACNNAGEGAFSGAALGAGGGAIIGSLTGSAGMGAVIGAVGGALTGAVIGDQNQRRAQPHYSSHGGYYSNCAPRYETYRTETYYVYPSHGRYCDR